MRNKYYSYFVPRTKEKGITDNWKDCEKMVKGETGARFKGFPEKKEAQEWLEMGASYDSKKELEPGIYFDAGTGAGNGVEIQVSDKTGKSFTKKLLGKDVTNNFGELTALKYALEIALEKNVFKIFGDSKLVIEYWSKGYIKYEVGEETVNLAQEVKILRKEFEKKGGKIILISGGANPADLGFHRG